MTLYAFRRVWSASALLVLTLSMAAAVSAAEVANSDRQRAADILEATGIQGGFIAHVGCGDGKITAALKANDGYLVQGLERDTAQVDAARTHVQSVGLYGEVSVDRWQGGKLPYVDNMVNLVIVEEGAVVPRDELLRVLTPGGVAYENAVGGWKKTIKPRPAEIDEWTHYLHDSSGNAVAHDTVVGPPRHLQWLGSPRWSRHHDRMASMSALVSANGRLFYIMDEGSRVSIQMPPKWTLIARDAFNGTILWKKPIATWHSHLWPLKSGPTQLARRLVAVGDRVYVTLGLFDPLTALDAATGKTLHTYEGSKGTEELIVSGGNVFCLVADGETDYSKYAPLHNVGDQRRVANEYHWTSKPRKIAAFHAESGRTLWSKESIVAPLTLAADGDRVVYHDGEKVVCVDQASGAENWHTPPASRRASITMNFGPKVVLYKSVVLYAGGDRSMRAYDGKSGKQIWSAPHAQSGYQSPEDLLVVDGLVWSAPTTSGRDTGVFTGRDPLTGESKVEFPPNVSTYWFHHRCYIAKATDRYILPSRTGIEFVDFAKQDWEIHHWVRGGCLYGIMPCNGLTYAPPHDCACYPEAKLFGFNALAPSAPTREAPREVSDAGRLERGPAFGDIADTKANDADWPTYRSDEGRSGRTDSAVSAELEQQWQAELGGRLSSVVVAGGRLFLAQIDAHAVHALDAASGKKLWSYTTGGRVDSPPTIYEGRVLFGSADGWVYCLRASDGELVWRFRAAPVDRRLMALEQLESVWPVHGNILVKDGVAYFVAGRSNFLDGGLRWIKLDAKTGKKLTEVVIDDRDPDTGENLQVRLQTLQMPVGLPDILSADSQYVYMRSQKFDFEGGRHDLGPHSGNAAEQGAAQQGEGSHLFSPTGFVDGSWFHRSYWVYGRSFAGGHNGYYQAGKYAPGGRIMVNDDQTVYGFGRKPEYLKWTTTLEHQLYAASKQAPEAAPPAAGRGNAGATMIRVAKSKSQNPAGKAIAVEAWINAERPEGVVVARGGPAAGYALIVRGGKPRFLVRSKSELSSVGAAANIVNKWTHLVGVLTADKKLELYINGKRAAAGQAHAMIDVDPAQALEVGADDKGAVGSYKQPARL